VNRIKRMNEEIRRTARDFAAARRTIGVSSELRAVKRRRISSCV